MSTKLLTKSIAFGILATFAAFGASWTALEMGFTSLGNVLYWQGWWLQSFLPCLNAGTPERPMCEGTPVNPIVFYLGLPFGIVLYSLVALVLLLVKKRNARSNRQ